MIVDTVNNANLYSSVHKELPALFAALKEVDILSTEPGKYEVPGSEAFFMIQQYTTRPYIPNQWEAHRAYIDVQIIFAGTEQIGYQHIDNLEIDKPYDAAADVAMLSGEGDMVSMKAGSFMILFPEDAHMPGLVCCEPCEVVKVVGKLPV